MVAVAQIILTAAGYEPGVVDGYAGHNTKEAFNAWDNYVTTGKPETLPGRSEEAVQAAPSKGPGRRPPPG